MVQSVYNEIAGALLEQLRANQERNDLVKNDLSSALALSEFASKYVSFLLPFARRPLRPYIL